MCPLPTAGDTKNEQTTFEQFTDEKFSVIRVKIVYLLAAGNSIILKHIHKTGAPVQTAGLSRLVLGTLE